MRRDPAKRDPAPRPQEDERPPFGRSWALLYAIVLLNLAVLIVLLTLFTKAFA